MGRIYMIIGKSASGKDHIYKKLSEDKELDLKKIVLYTTRPKREGEEEGREYYFTDTVHLEELRKKGLLIEERVYDTVYGKWHYFTADEGQILPENNSYITIGTLQSYIKMKSYFGDEIVRPLYIQTEDGERLLRAIKRQQKEKIPEYKELCRRFLADEEDFSEEKLKEAGIERRFSNDAELSECIDEIKSFICSDMR